MITQLNPKQFIDATNQQRVEQFNSFVMQQDIDRLPIGLFGGKTGLAIYFYHQARLTGEKQYEIFADKLLDTIQRQIHKELPINLETGLTGICYGFLHLIENGFVNGNPNVVLKELEEKIFKMLYFLYLSEKQHNDIEVLKSIVHCSLYFCKRLTDKRLAKNEKHIFEQTIIRVINTIEMAAASEKMKEPYLFSRYDYFPVLYLELIEKVYKLGFYTYKLDKVCDEWNERLLSALPLLKSNRLLMAAAMEKVNVFHKSEKWQEHISLLRQKADIETAIDTDFRNKNLCIAEGLTGFYLFLKENNLLSDSIQELIFGKIAGSEIWRIFETGTDNDKLYHIGLMTGFPGVILVTHPNNLRK